MVQSWGRVVYRSFWVGSRDRRRARREWRRRSRRRKRLRLGPRPRRSRIEKGRERERDPSLFEHASVHIAASQVVPMSITRLRMPTEGRIEKGCPVGLLFSFFFSCLVLSLHLSSFPHLKLRLPFSRCSHPTTCLPFFFFFS